MKPSESRIFSFSLKGHLIVAPAVLVFVPVDVIIRSQSWVVDARAFRNGKNLWYYS